MISESQFNAMERQWELQQEKRYQDEQEAIEREQERVEAEGDEDVQP